MCTCRFRAKNTLPKMMKMIPKIVNTMNTCRPVYTGRHAGNLC